VLVLVDLNHFKAVNDRLGHVSGDKVLVYIAGQLKRSGAKVVRYGGDEFLLVFGAGVGTEDARKKLHIIRELVMKKTLKVNEQSFKTSFSYGIAGFKEGELFESVVNMIDKMMYVDKEKIKERVAPPF
jgi:diguanylate cyclase (GGDEF)-like protein